MPAHSLLGSGSSSLICHDSHNNLKAFIRLCNHSPASLQYPCITPHPLQRLAAALCMLGGPRAAARLVVPAPFLASWCSLSSSTSASSVPQDSVRKPAISQKTRFIDQLRVVARGGQGGGGSSALFGRTGHHPRAAGGNGAPGGAVLLRATRQLTGLGSVPLHVEARRGGHGGKQWMEGKKGADKVVHVPLGTMVWRLLQLRGPGHTHTPHGVTPQKPTVEARASAQHSPVQTVEQQHQQPIVETQSDIPQDTRTHLRRSLFEHSQQLPAGASPGGVSAARSSSSTDSQDLQQQQQHATALGDIDSGDEAADEQLAALYDDLLQCRRVLSNAEKLHLLHYGSLADGPIDSLGWDVQAGQRGMSGSSSDTDSGSGSELEEFEGDGHELEGDAWGQDSSGSEWRRLGEHGEVGQRQFSKEQVWSILSAQAELLGVLEVEGQELVVAAGGRGGRGNAVAPSNHHRPASKVRSDGQPGQEVLLQLQLRLMADVALLGLPNVGKSSLITALTTARAQVGSYAFTTIRPQLGSLLPAVPDAQPSAEQSEQPDDDTGSGILAAAAAAGKEAATGLTGHQLVLADLPGLVPGAHEGKGRGICFLQHSMKARCIALVIDLTGGSLAAGDSDAGRSPEATGAGPTQPGAECWEAQVAYSPQQQLEILLDELRCFDASTLSKPMLVVANKVDALSATDAAKALQRLKAVTDLPIVPVSARQRLGLARLTKSMEDLAGGVGAAA